jgi:hypothetical protein
MAVTVTDPIKILFAILLPPLRVFLEGRHRSHAAASSLSAKS